MPRCRPKGGSSIPATCLLPWSAAFLRFDMKLWTCESVLQFYDVMYFLTSPCFAHLSQGDL